MMERLDDIELNTIADARANEPIIKVKLDDL
jgi:antitoxin StbD